MPFKVPNIPPANTPKIEDRKIGNPAFSNNPINIPVNATVLPTDKSMPLVEITKVMPMAIINCNAA